MRLKTPIAPSLAAALLAGGLCGTAPIAAQTVTSATATLQVATGRGRLVTLDAPISDVFVASDAIADVSVRSPRQIYIFGKSAGETTVFATAKSGRVVYSATVRVGNNFDSVGSMLKLAMPDANIVATPMNGVILLTGTVQNPDDAAEAERLVQAFVGKDIQVITRLKTAVPLQVNLQVRFAEVSRSFVKNLGVNITNRDSGKFIFGIAQGKQGTIKTNISGAVDASGAGPGGTIYTFPSPSAGNTLLGIAGHAMGMDLLGSLDIGETIGQVTTLANPNLTALSGETGTFLAGGEIPIPISQALGTVSVEYKQYGVSLAYTPTVLSDGRISLRVRPEVSQLSSSGAVTLNGTTIPALTTRRAETTVELGSGQSFMIAGLLQNTDNNTITKTPGVGDLPILGALFRSNGFQRNETELVIVITPYLVKPANAADIKLPTDGYRHPDDFQRFFLGQLSNNQSGGERPKPTMAPSPDAAPVIGAVNPAPATPAEPATPGQAPAAKAAPGEPKKKDGPAAAPGFNLN